MDKKQTIETILKQINADCIIAHHVESDMYIQNFPSRWGGWQVRSPVTWRVIENYPGQPNITVVAFDVLLRAQPDWEGSFQFPGTNDWVRNQCASLAITDEELSMDNLYQIICNRVHAAGKEMANWRPGLVKFDNFDFGCTDNPSTITGQASAGGVGVGDSAKDIFVFTDDGETKEEPKKINQYVLQKDSLGHDWMVLKEATENEADEPVAVEKKINFREWL